MHHFSCCQSFGPKTNKMSSFTALFAFIAGITITQEGAIVVAEKARNLIISSINLLTP